MKVRVGYWLKVVVVVLVLGSVLRRKRLYWFVNVFGKD